MKRFVCIVLLFIACAVVWVKCHVECDDVLYNELKGEKFGVLDKEKCLSIIVGMDYIPYKFIELFEKLTHVRVTVDISDSNEILESKLLAGGAQYDLVFPTAWPNFSRQLQANIYRKIDHSKIDISVFDKDIMQRLAEYDEGNLHAVPYQFGIAGIGVRENIVNKILPNVSKDSLALIFDPKNAAKLRQYRISIYDSPNELFPALLLYLGKDPNSKNVEDICAAARHLQKIRKYIAKFSSFGFEDLASGSACVTLSTSGDILEVQKNDTNANIKFYYPKEGTSLWVDVVAIPRGARHINNAYAFLRFLFHPKVISSITNATSRANAVVAADKYVNKTLTNNPYIYPTTQIREKCYIEKPLPPHIERLKTRLLTRVKSGEDL